jgi:hypothetical protein
MKKYFFTSVFSLLLIAGVSLTASACPPKNASTSTAAKTECENKTTSSEVQAVQTVQTSNEAKSSCSASSTATTEAAQSGSSCCASAVQTVNTQKAEGECTKIPAGVGQQRADRERN